MFDTNKKYTIFERDSKFIRIYWTLQIIGIKIAYFLLSIFKANC